MPHDKYRLLLIELTGDQIERARTLNGPRRRITHAVMVPGVGQRFGTLKQCARYYEAWNQIYVPLLLRRGEPIHGNDIEIDDFESDPDLSLKLAELHDSRERLLPAAQRNRLRRRTYAPDASVERAAPGPGCAAALASLIAALAFATIQVHG